MKTTLSFPLSLFSALFVVTCVPAFAADEIEEVLITAKATKGEPGNMLMSSEDIAKIQANSLESLLSNQSSVAVGGGAAAAQKIYVRGFEDVMLNVTVDGAQAPGDLYHHQSRVQLEPEFIKTLELDAGAGSATNGAGALTGALRVSIKNAFDLLKDDESWGALVKGTGIINGNDGSKGSVASYGKLADNVGLIVGFTQENRDEYADGKGNVIGTSPYDHRHGFAKVNGTTNNHEMSLTFEDLADSATTFERPNLSNFSGGFLLSDQEINRQTVALNDRYNPASEWVDLRTSIYRNDSDFKVQRQSSNIIYGEGDFVSTGFDLRNSIKLGAHQIIVGTDYRVDDLESSQNATPPDFWGTTEQQAKVNGVYLQDHIALSSRVNLSGGLRYDRYQFESEKGVSQGVSIDDNGVSPNISIDWEIVDGLVVRSAYSQAFRGVAIREAFFSALFVNDGSLESEKADNMEFGIAYDSDNYFIHTTVYQQNIDNFIDVVDGNDQVWGFWKNIGDAKVKGYELEVGAHFDGLKTSVGVWDADNSLNGKSLTDAQLGLGTSIGRTWLAKLDYNFANMDLNVGTHIRYVEAEENTISANAPDKKAYTTVKIYANWMPTNNLTLAMTVNNLFDEFYYDHATYTYIGWANAYAGYPSVGREATVSVSYRF